MTHLLTVWTLGAIHPLPVQWRSFEGCSFHDWSWFSELSELLLPFFPNECCVCSIKAWQWLNVENCRANLWAFSSSNIQITSLAASHLQSHVHMGITWCILTSPMDTYVLLRPVEQEKSRKSVPTQTTVGPWCMPQTLVRGETIASSFSFGYVAKIIPVFLSSRQQQKKGDA